MYYIALKEIPELREYVPLEQGLRLQPMLPQTVLKISESMFH